jgi:hypothetical protein
MYKKILYERRERKMGYLWSWLILLNCVLLFIHSVTNNSFSQEPTCHVSLCDNFPEEQREAITSVSIPAVHELTSTDWVQHKLLCYPELRWLLDSEVQHTQEGTSHSFEHSWSLRIEGRHYPEFERTMLSMAVLYLILDGDDEAYEKFTFLQSEGMKLSRESFSQLHAFAKQVIRIDTQQLQAIEVNLLLGDMGKTRIARQKAKEYGVVEPDHDLFLEACLEKCPQIFPTYIKQSSEIQAKIKDVSGLVHFGHVAHVEGGPEILTKLKMSRILEREPHPI